MKRLTLITIALLFGISTYSQSKETIVLNNTDTVEVEIGEAERIVDKYTDKITNGFNGLFEKVAPYAEQGFRFVVKLKIAEGVAYLFVVLFSFFFWSNFVKYYKIAKEDTFADWPAGKYGGLAVILLVFSIITTIATPFCLYHGLTLVIAPEWFAIKEIIELVK